MTTIIPPTFDANNFPDVIAADTSFLIRALDKRHEDEGRCWHLLDALQKEQTLVIVPMVAYAEYIIKAPIPFPRSKWLRPVAFDQLAALQFQAFTNDTMKKLQKDCGDRTIVRHDAIIIATAKRHGVKSILAVDVNTHMRAACEAFKVDIVGPHTFESQLTLTPINKTASGAEVLHDPATTTETKSKTG